MPVGTIWTLEEDQRLAQLVDIHGPKKWSQIASDLGTKGSKQCRRRWKNFISLEERKQGSWTPEEDAMLLDGHNRHGNKWTLIAQEIGGRTDNAVKNRWAALEKKRRADDEGCQQQKKHAPAMRTQSMDLLGVRRIISKDRPSCRGMQVQVADAAWMEELRQDDQFLPRHISYPVSSGLSMQPPMQSLDHMHNNATFKKPDLVINIPGSGVAEPQLPYSHKSQGNAAFTAQKDLQVAQDLQAMDLPSIHPDTNMRIGDDPLLSTSRRAGQNALATLTSPSEEPGTIRSLYKYLCSATPVDAQQQVMNGQRPLPPWVATSSNMGAEGPQPGMMQQQLLPPPPLLQSDLLPLQPQLSVQDSMQLQPQLGTQGLRQLQAAQVPQYQQLPVTAGTLAPCITSLQQQQQQQQRQMQQVSQSVSSQLMHMPQRQHESLSAGAVSWQHSDTFAAQPASSYAPGWTYVIQPGQQMQMPAPTTEPAALQARHPQTCQQTQYHNIVSCSYQSVQTSQYMPPVMSNSMASSYGPQQLPQQQLLLPGQQLQQHDNTQLKLDEQQQWGPEELRQLLDLLDGQQQSAEQQSHMPGPEAVSTSMYQPGSVPGSAGMSPSIPEEQVEHVNNGHGRMDSVPQPGNVDLSHPIAVGYHI